GVEQLISDVVDYAKNNSRVTTLREALNRSGNVIEVGDYTKTTRPERLGGSHFVVGSGGTISGSTTFAKINQYDTNTKWWEFPLGKSVCAITSDHPSLNEFPEGRIGTLITVRPAPQGSYAYQEYRIFRTNVTYYSVLGVDEEFEEWTFGSQRIHFNHERQSNWSFYTGIKDYRQGITFNEVKSTNIDIDDAPERRPGIRVTFKVTEDGLEGLNYQEYHLNYKRIPTIYKRTAKNENEWNEWVLVGPTIELDETSNHTFSDGIDAYIKGVTYTTISSNHSDLADAPEGEPGLLITHNVSFSLASSMQEYHLNYKTSRLSIYKRRPTSSSAWSP